MTETWRRLNEWPELILERLDGAGVARIILNRPEKRNCWNRPMANAFVESLDIVRADKELKVVITKGAGTIYSSGLDLAFLREVSNGPLLDWDRPNLTIQIAEALRAFPRILIAQVHGYCLGGALGIVSQAVPAGRLEEHTNAFARDLATRHLAPLEHHKITVQMGRDLSLSQAIQLDQLVGHRMRRTMDPLDDVESYLKSQKGGPNLSYKRPDV